MSDLKAWTLTVNKDGFAELIMDCPKDKVNKFSSDVMDEFSGVLDELRNREDIDVLSITSAKEGIYIAGADISEIQELTHPDEAREKACMGQAVFNKLEELPFVTVAVIRGACLGGGLEMALACDFRVASDSPKTIMGLPEVTLGIIPGFAGTQRLPRLIGLEESLKLILKGKLINAKKAYQIKLVDLYAPEAFFEERLQAFLKSVKEPSKQRILKERRKKYKWMSRLVESNILGRHLIFKKTREMLQKQTQGHYPAPLVAIDVLEETYDKTKLTEGLKIEAEAFAPLPGNPVCQNLVRLFFVREELKKNLGVKTTAKLPEISHAAVLGAGTMGGGIAWLFSSKNIPVLMKDLTWEAVRLGYQTASGIYDQLIKIKKYKPAQVNVKMHAITGTVDYAGFENTDIVVEAIVEDMAIKKSVLAKLEGNVSKSTILATNTSALSVTEMATDLKRPAKFIGMHFFNPVNRMPLVEVIPGEKTSKATIAATVALCKRLGKTPIVVQNCPGFLVNRVLIPYVNEAAFLLVEGVAINHLDSLVKSFGLPMGPFSLADVVGLDVGYKVAHILEEGFGERMAVAPILKILVEEHHVLGQKNGNGFYRGLRSQRSENPKVKSVVQSFQKANGIQKSLISDHDLLDRCILIMANEAARCIEESIVEKPGYLDMAMIMGAGFPPFRGGLLRYIDERGVGTVVERLQQLATKYDERFKPCELLKEMAEKGHLFYS